MIETTLHPPQKSTILEVFERISPFIHKTPILTSQIINDLTGRNITFKCENFQKAGAFKSRGACNAVYSLSDVELKKGVATHSSGNHAQALARAANLRGIPAYIVMPENSSKVKVNGVAYYNGKITFCKPTLEARETTLAEVIQATGATEIHPYNDYRIIAGQATAGLEILNERPDTQLIIAPVGGGGLLSGTALAALYFGNSTKVIAAEPEQANDAYQSFKSGYFIPSVSPDTIADGLRTSLGSLTYPIIQKYVEDIVTVTENGIISAMRLIWERMKIIVEPSSAVALAAILENKIPEQYTNICVLISGGNVDFNDLPWKP
jgi:threonine dehydratase